MVQESSNPQKRVGLGKPVPTVAMEQVMMLYRLPRKMCGSSEASRLQSCPPKRIDLHRISHLPYRSWCPEWVEAFARE